MLKKRRCVLPALMLMLVVAGCGSGHLKNQDNLPQNTEQMQEIVDTVQLSEESLEEDIAKVQEVTFTDSLGNLIVLPGQPEKVAVLFSSFADIWKTAGGEMTVTVGETVERGFADSTAVLVDAGAGKSINMEALIAAEPDFVICSADIEAQAQAAELLRGMGIPCAEFRVESFEDYLTMLKICTDITGKPENYTKYGEEIAKRIDDIMNKIPENNAGPEILFIRSGAGESSAKAKTAKDHFAAAMLKELGACNIAEDAPVLLDGLSVEEIIRRDPEEIFITTMGKEQAAKEYMDSVIATKAWQSLTAVQTGRYQYLPKELFQFKPNARWDEAYLYLAKLLYPEIIFE